MTLEPTCTEKGKITYTAVFGAEWAAPYSEVLASIPALDHTRALGEALEHTCIKTGLTEGPIALCAAKS